MADRNRTQAVALRQSLRAYNLIGRRFGKLVVIELAGSYVLPGRGESGGRFWICRCDCGAITKPLRTCNLTASKGKRSCGCTPPKNYTGTPDGSSFNRLYSIYRTDALKRGFTFNLNREQFRELTSEPCFYCGQKPSQLCKPRFAAGSKWLKPYLYNGVDRRDNAVGYTTNNSVSCCGACNKMKRIMSDEDFILLCNRIAVRHPRI